MIRSDALPKTDGDDVPEGDGHSAGEKARPDD